MSNVDISPEAVRKMHKRLGSTPFPDYLEEIVSDADMMIAALLSRIAELEADNAILRTEKHADTEAIAAMKEEGMDRLVAEGQKCDAIAIARNDALREAAQIVGRYDEESTCPSCCDVTAINEEITALIEGDTND